MDVMFTHCAGLDVHKKTVTACRVTPDPTGREADGIVELRVFGTMTGRPAGVVGLVGRGGDHACGHGKHRAVGPYRFPGRTDRRAQCRDYARSERMVDRDPLPT
jgi:hypothetical protein